MSSVKSLAEKPPKFQVQFDNIPPLLANAKGRWALWKWERGGNKWTKVPYRFGGDAKAANNKPSHWGTLARAGETLATGDFDGVGFALATKAENSEFTVVDLDNCRDRLTGEVQPWAEAAIESLNSYTEISPSGEGVKVWLKGAKPPGNWDTSNGNYEVFGHARYLCVTGHVYKNYRELREGGDALLAFLREHMQREVERGNVTSALREYTLPVDTAETLKLAAEAIKAIDPDCDYETWTSIGMAIHSLAPDAGFGVWNAWSSGGSDYPGEPDLKTKWASFQKSGITIGTLFHHAKLAGFQMPRALGIGFPSGRTDIANADRFVNSYGDRIRFVTEWNEWLVWDGRRWLRGDAGAVRLAKEYAKGLWPELGKEIDRSNLVDEKKINAVVAFIRATNNKRGILDFLALAQSDPRVAISYQALDAHPHLLNCQNGVLDFETGKFDPVHKPELLLTQLANVSYDPRAKYPQWTDTMGLICDGDLELYDYQQQILGYSCVGGNPNAILPIMYGDGRNGKSTVWLTVQGILGDYAMVANKELIVGSRDQHPTIFADLYRKRLVTIAEPEEGSSLRESDVKRLSGSDEIRARRMREDTWAFKPTHTIWVASNHKLSVGGTDKGIWRRLKLIPYTVDISLATTEKKDFHLWLLKNESSGILNWLLAGYQRYLALGRNFAEPECVKTATTEYRVEEDVFGRWVSENCDTEAGTESTFRELFECYRYSGGKLGEKKFAKSLKERFDSYVSNKGATRGQQMYLGISLKPRLVHDFG